MGQLKKKGFNIKKPTAVSVEENILKAMIEDDKAIKKIMPVFDPMLLQSDIGRKVGKWLFDYFTRYGDAPKDYMIDMIESESRKVEDEKEEELLLLFADNKLRERKEMNVDPWIDEAKEYFESRRLMTTMEDVRTALKREDLSVAKTSLRQYEEGSLEIKDKTDEEFINLMDSKQVDELYTKHIEERKGGVLFEFPKPLNTVLRPVRRRTVDIYQAPPKTGKTFLMLDIMRMAARKGLNCVMFQCGDLYIDQVLERWWSRMTERPVIFTQNDDMDMRSGKVILHHPVRDCLWNQMGVCPDGGEGMFKKDERILLTKKKYKSYHRTHVPCTACFNNREAPHEYQGSVWWETIRKTPLEGTGPVKKAIKKIERRTGHKINVHLKCFEMGKATEQDLFTELELFKQTTGINPDLVGIDYMQALECSDQSLSPRDQNNKKWIAGRQIADRFDCAVLSVSHTDAGALDGGSQKKSNFSENRRIYDHAANVYAIDQSESEEKLDIVRFRSFYTRYSKKSHSVVSVPRCLELGQALVTGFIGAIDSFNEMADGIGEQPTKKKTKGKTKK